MLRLLTAPNFTTTSDLAAMLTAFLLFLVSGATFVILIPAALLSLIMSFSDWRYIFAAVWSWGALFLSAWHIVKAIELINAPSWSELAFAGIRSVLVTAVAPIFWYLASGILL